jgi:proline dehydrogenase
MGLMRKALLAGSQSPWLKRQATQRAFVRRAVSRFMPGEHLDDALAAAQALREKNLPSVLTRLGENVASEEEADEVREHYLGALDKIAARGAAAEISVKPTQLGLDLDRERCFARLAALVERANQLGNFVWIDMEQSRYVDATLELCRRACALRQNVGVCLQAYLRRTAADLAALVPTGAGIRLVKGAYMEPAEVAFPSKVEVDRNYFLLAGVLFDGPARASGVRAVFGTHDPRLALSIRALAQARGMSAAEVEFHMLYGIQVRTQEFLVAEGARVRVLISYGDYWFPWYMRRLAERPANVLFVVRSLFRR